MPFYYDGKKLHGTRKQVNESFLYCIKHTLKIRQFGISYFPFLLIVQISDIIQSFHATPFSAQAESHRLSNDV